MIEAVIYVKDREDFYSNRRVRADTTKRLINEAYPLTPLRGSAMWAATHIKQNRKRSLETSDGKETIAFLRLWRQ